MFSSMAMRTEAEIKAAVDAEFAELERNAGPGLLQVLEVYGNAQDAVQQAEAYLTGAPSTPIITTTNNTSR
jgi:hypothetical protein